MRLGADLAVGGNEHHREHDGLCIERSRYYDLSCFDKICVAMKTLALLAALLCLGCQKPAPIAPALPPGSQAPSVQFLKDYDEYMALSNDVAAKQDALAKTSRVKQMQEEQDRAVGMGQRLSQSVPAGYMFDAKTRAFLPRPVAPAPPQVAAPKK